MSDLWHKLREQPRVRSGARRFLIIAVLLPLLIVLATRVPMPPEYRVLGSFILILVFFVLMNRANKDMNAERQRIFDDENRRRVQQGLPPKKQRKFLRWIFPFYT